MQYVFGPVPSRRLGRSLGIDTVPLKTCNWNCIYCQLGRSRPVINERREYFPREAVIEEVRSALRAHRDNGIDWITFVASGETVLHSEIGWLIREVKQLTDKPVAVITNGSLFYLPEVREALYPADAVLPSLDAGSEELYKRVNRPHPELTLRRHIVGLRCFRRQFRGRLWVEVMLIAGMNDTELALKNLRDVLRRIRPDEIHLLRPERPPVETWVEPPDEEGMMRATAILGDVARVVPAVGTIIEFSAETSAADAIAGIVARHPMNREQFAQTLPQWSGQQIANALAELQTAERVKKVTRYGVEYWVANEAWFPNTDGARK